MSTIDSPDNGIFRHSDFLGATLNTTWSLQLNTVHRLIKISYEINILRPVQTIRVWQQPKWKFREHSTFWISGSWTNTIKDDFTNNYSVYRQIKKKKSISTFIGVVYNYIIHKHYASIVIPLWLAVVCHPQPTQVSAPPKVTKRHRVEQVSRFGFEN